MCSIVLWCTIFYRVSQVHVYSCKNDKSNISLSSFSYILACKNASGCIIQILARITRNLDKNMKCIVLWFSWKICILMIFTSLKSHFRLKITRLNTQVKLWISCVQKHRMHILASVCFRWHLMCLLTVAKKVFGK